MTDPAAKPTLLYNDDCPVCRFEIDHHKGKAAKGDMDLGFAPVSQADLDRWGLTEEAALRQLHLWDGQTLLTGMDAQRGLWARAPGWRWLAWITGLPGLRQGTDLAYRRLAAPLLYGMHKRRAAQRAGTATPKQ